MQLSQRSFSDTDQARRIPSATLVNDVHSQLNPTHVSQIVLPSSLPELQRAVARAGRLGRAVSIAGRRHSMGGQQFGTSTVLLDTTHLARVLDFDFDRGLVTIEAGATWPVLMEQLSRRQSGRPQQWGIAQKQTGADHLSLGGALAANIHGRGLTFKPLVDDVESFVLVTADGRVLTCSRSENLDLFRLVIGGYGLFGIVYAVTLRLIGRHKVERRVEVAFVDRLMENFEQRVAEGFEFGDFQFAIDPRSKDFLRRGVFSCYRPLDDDRPIRLGQYALTTEDWGWLAYFAHRDKSRAFDEYSRYYLATDGQIYWSDTHQLAEYVEGYHATLDQVTNAQLRGTEIITELYVPRPALAAFMADAADELRRLDADVIYGTIRLIERDEETMLAWARERWACIVFNLHTVHSPLGVARSSFICRRLIDLAIRHEGSFSLAYHRWASHDQVEAGHPRFAEFLRLKTALDPDERFESDWYRHYRAMFDGQPTR